MSGDRSSGNPFIRFKNSVDGKVEQFVSSWQQEKGDDGKAQAEPKALGSNNDASSTESGGKMMVKASSSGSAEWSSAGAQGSANGISSVQDIAGHLQSLHVRSWAVFSPYSPRNLGHLAQPVPRDAQHWAGEHFTFEDAYEDLLDVGSGKPMRSPEQLWADRRGERSQMKPIFDGGSLVPKSDRASLSDRWNAYFPITSFEQSASRIRYELASISARLGADIHPSRMNRLANDLMTREARCDEEREVDDMKQLLARLYMEGRVADYGDLIKLLQARSPWMREDWHEIWRRAQTSAQPQALEAQRAHEDMSQEAQTEEDLYQSQQARSSLTVIPPLVWEAPTTRRPESQDAVSAESDGSVDESTQHSRNGDRTVTRNEKKVIDGITQVKQTITRYDSDGNVRSRSVVTRAYTGEEGDDEKAVQTQSRSYSYSYSWGTRSRGASSDSYNGENGADADTEQEGNPQKKGWFWSGWF